MKVLALAFMALHLIGTLSIASKLGKPRDPYTTEHLAVSYLLDVVVVILCGHIMEWW